MVPAGAAGSAMLLHDFDYFAFAAADNEVAAVVVVIVAGAEVAVGADVLGAVFGPPTGLVADVDARRILAFSAAQPPSVELGEQDC